MALSFVRSADDIRALKDRLRKAARDLRRPDRGPEAVARIDDIIGVTDGHGGPGDRASRWTWTRCLRFRKT